MLPARNQLSLLDSMGVNTLAMVWTNGIDISHWQDEHIDWGMVMGAGYWFASIKASEGTGYADHLFKKNWQNSKNPQFFRSAYHWIHPSMPIIDSPRGIGQVSWFLKCVGDDLGELPLTIDAEDTDGRSTDYLVNRTIEMAFVLKERTKKQVLIYTSPGAWVGGNYKKAIEFDLHDANYTEASVPWIPKPWKDYKIWQWYKGATHQDVPGINEGCDKDRFNGTYEDLKNYAVGTYTPPPPPTPDNTRKCVVITRSLYIRSKPTTASAALGGLRAGDVFYSDKQVDRAGETWLKIKDKEAYVARFYNQMILVEFMN